MGIAGDVNIWMGLLALLPLVVYIILVFRDADPIPVTIILLCSVAIIGTGTAIGNVVMPVFIRFQKPREIQRMPLSVRVP